MQTASDELVKRAKESRGAVSLARDKAKPDARAPYDDVLLRIDCGTDVTSVGIGKVTASFDHIQFELRKSRDGIETPHLEIVVNAVNAERAEHKIIFKKARLFSLKTKLDMPVLARDKQPFEKVLPPEETRQISYVNDISSNFKWEKGTRVVCVFEFTVGNKSGTVRTPVVVLK